MDNNWQSSLRTGLNFDVHSKEWAHSKTTKKTETEQSMTDHPLLTSISSLYSLGELKQSSEGPADYKPQHGRRSKHFKVEYKLVCLQDIMAYNLVYYKCLQYVYYENAGQIWKRIIQQTVFSL